MFNLKYNSNSHTPNWFGHQNLCLNHFHPISLGLEMIECRLHKNNFVAIILDVVLNFVNNSKMITNRDENKT